ncbi:hypothetical protein C1646_678987, partial [Rhizophagus diaphanus]
NLRMKKLLFLVVCMIYQLLPMNFMIRLNHILVHLFLINFQYMEYLKIQIQKNILWFFKMFIVKNVVKNILQ